MAPAAYHPACAANPARTAAGRESTPPSASLSVPNRRTRKARACCSVCACANITELVSVIRNETRTLRPLVEKGIIRGFDIGDESGCPPEEAALAAAIHAELKGLERGRDYYVYKNECQAHPPTHPSVRCANPLWQPACVQVLQARQHEQDQLLPRCRRPKRDRRCQLRRMQVATTFCRCRTPARIPLCNQPRSCSCPHSGKVQLASEVLRVVACRQTNTAPQRATWTTP